MISIVSSKAERQIFKLSLRNTFRSLVLEKRLKWITNLSTEMVIQNWCWGNGSYMPKKIRKEELQRWVGQFKSKRYYSSGFYAVCVILQVMKICKRL